MGNGSTKYLNQGHVIKQMVVIYMHIYTSSLWLVDVPFACKLNHICIAFLLQKEHTMINNCIVVSLLARDSVDSLRPGNPYMRRRLLPSLTFVILVHGKDMLLCLCQY